MKQYSFYKYVILLVLFLISSITISNGTTSFKYVPIEVKPIYDDIWGTIYNAEASQCDETPNITGDGSKININKASEHRWIAISQEMLDDKYRMNLLNNESSLLYKGRIKYGDTIWIDSPHKAINGLWVVHDTKNSRYKNSIDFLQTKGDGSLYNNDPLWSGRFDSIQLFKSKDDLNRALAQK